MYEKFFNKKSKLKTTLAIIMFFFIVSVIVVFFTIIYFSFSLPNHKNLKDYNPPLTTRLYNNNGKYLKEYAKEKRLFIPIEQIPNLVKNAFISAEDTTFYTNIGISPKGILSAGFESIISKITGKGRIRGGSTITQQVAKIFLLSNEKTLTRKIKEAILSFRLNNTFSKDKILELYLNQIFLGNRSYGIASAALNYFNKSLDELTIEEVAMLAALPKAPGTLDPTRNNDKSIIERRNWIIERMYKLGYINKEDVEKAKETPINLKEKDIEFVSNGEFFSEEVRKEIVKMYGEKELLENGNVVITTLDQKLQTIADKYLKVGIEEYDIRHGFRGAIGNLAGEIAFDNNWANLIQDYKIPKKRNEWDKAVVLKIDTKEQRIIIGLKKIDYSDEYGKDLESNEFIKSSNDEKLLIMGYIPLKNLAWAKKYINVDSVGKEPEKVEDLELKKGDVIVVEKNSAVPNEYFLKQIPAIDGALVAMEPYSGKILAMMGGYIDSQIDFNRVSQAKRQPGSTIKPFVYLAALENGLTPSSIIIDEEIELYQGENRPPYKPKNTEGHGIYFGPTTLRVGLEKSRNVVTVRLASDIGLRKVVEVIKRFGINENPRRIYSLALGSTETNLLKMVRAYSMIVNGGKIIEPTLIEKIQDKNGKIIFSRDRRECFDCKIAEDIPLSEIIIPTIKNNKIEIIDSATAFQIINMLEGVVQRGSGWRAKSIGKVIGAKTGTTNDGKDAWFIGFSPDLVVGVYVGFDKPKYMGNNEFGSSVAGPIFTNFMKEALSDTPSIPFRIPTTVKLIRIDTKTGYYPTPNSNTKDIVTEAFKINDKITEFKEDDYSSEDAIEEMLDNQNNKETFRIQPEIIDRTINKDNSENERLLKEMQKNDYIIDIE